MSDTLFCVCKCKYSGETLKLCYKTYKKVAILCEYRENLYLCIAIGKLLIDT